MEETIEEFASDLCEEFNKNEYDNYYWLSMDSARTIVKGLIAKGYRKESDTAREILDELLKEKNLENVYFTDENGDIRNRQVIRIEKIKDLAEKYGVDLGE